MAASDHSSVRVAVRVRPLSNRERAEFQSTCLTVVPVESQIVIGTERAFTYDFAFGTDAAQLSIFENTTRDLVDGCFGGLNATVLAYGQTGSGKTFTMGTGFDVDLADNDFGIIPRAVDHFFRVIHQKQEDAREQNAPLPLFELSVQFIELYQDELIDLLDRASMPAKVKRRLPPKLGEDKNGHVVLHNVCVKSVSCKDEVMDWLRQGALSRTTGSTNMNAQSSRSHAIFTLSMKQTVQIAEKEGEEVGDGDGIISTSASFHFVDLAGSERLKRTGAVGSRAKESIAINGGLLALGNVISKLGDRSLKATHIPYRSSKLTRLLQDSLGGNSQTLMIACVSPAEQDFVETLNTLRYANRARNIQNKVVVNQDKSSQTIAMLRARAQELEMMLLEYQQGKRQPGVEAYNDMFLENSALQKENEALRLQLRTANQISEEKTVRNTELRVEVERLKEVIQTGNSMDVDQNCTDTEKQLRKYYCELLEEKDSSIAEMKRQFDLLQGNSMLSPHSPHRPTSGSRTYRVRKTQTLSPLQKQTGLFDEENSDVPSFETLDGDDDVLDSLDEKILEREKELEEMKMALSSQKENYEHKIHELTERIRSVENERTAHIENTKGSGVDKTRDREREVKYQQDLAELKRQLKEQEKNLSDYRKLQKDKAVYEVKVEKLSRNIDDLKRMRVEAMRKMEQENKKQRAREVEQSRSLSQKDRAQQHLKRELAEQKILVQQKQMLITRLRADLLVARKSPKTIMSDQIAGRIGKSQYPDENVLKQRWEEFMRYFYAVAYKKSRLKVFDRQLKSYNEELCQLRESAQKLETKYSFAVEKEERKEAEELRHQIEDQKSAIHFIEKQNSEIQNEACSCEESTEEYNHVDPSYLRTKFADENSLRFFLDSLIGLTMSQNEEIHVLENRANARNTEHAILIKERNVLREILQCYLTDGGNQNAVDIAGVAKSHLEDAGSHDLTSAEVVRNIINTPVHTKTAQRRQKARQRPLLQPLQMLTVPVDNNHHTSSASPSSDDGTFDKSGKSSSSSNGSVSDKSIMAPPKIPSVRALKKDQRIKKDKTPAWQHTNALAVTGVGLSSGPKISSRCASMTDLSGGSSAHHHEPHSGHSLENVIPSALKVTIPPRRHACQADLVSPKPHPKLRK